MREEQAASHQGRGPVGAVAGGVGIGTLGGLIGLGGAEFRLPLLLGAFRFGPLEAVIVNKAMSLIVVASALPFRTAAIPLTSIADNWIAVANLLAGSLIGAWVGASWATRLRSQTFYKIIAALLVVIAVVLVIGHGVEGGGPSLTGVSLAVTGVAAGFAIGVIASLMGVAGGELLIPTFILLFGADVKLAGSLSLVVSLPTMLVGFARYARDDTFQVLRRNRVFVLFMAAGSIVGTFVGARLLGIVPDVILLPALALILLISAVKVWRHA